MNHNKLITEELRAITALMSYDRSKTLMEQPESVMDRRLGITQRNADALGMDVRDYEKVVFGSGDVKWDHETAGYAELILTVGGFLVAATGVGAPLGSLMIAGGTAIGVADALVYFNENDPYMGTMMLALQLIPGGELDSVLKKSGRFVKFGSRVTDYISNMTPQQMKALIDKGKESFDTLSDFQKLVLKALKEGVEDTAPVIVKNAAKIALKAFKTKLGQFVLKKVFGSIVGLLKFTGKTVVKVAGVAIGVDKLWTLMSTPESWRTKMRNKAQFSKIMDMLYEGTLDDALINGMWVIWQKLWNTDGSPNTEGIEEIKQDLINGNIDEDLFDNANEETINDVVFNYDKHIKGLNNPWHTNNEAVTKMKNNYLPVKFDNLVKGLQTIRKGQKGDVVRDIQRMLVTIGYDLGNTGPQGDGVDGDFGESTEASIYELQLDHNLDGVDGIVGQETAKKLKELYDEKRR